MCIQTWLELGSSGRHERACNAIQPMRSVLLLLTTPAYRIIVVFLSLIFLVDQQLRQSNTYCMHLVIGDAFHRSQGDIDVVDNQLEN
jgi:hypothetical protein